MTIFHAPLAADDHVIADMHKKKTAPPFFPNGGSNSTHLDLEESWHVDEKAGKHDGHKVVAQLPEPIGRVGVANTHVAFERYGKASVG